MILHYNWFCIDKRIDHLKWTSNNKNSYYTKELCSRFLHIHVLKNSRILYTFVRAYFAYLLLKNLRTVIVQKLQSVHWLLHVQINHDCIIIENIFNSCLWGTPFTRINVLLTFALFGRTFAAFCLNEGKKLQHKVKKLQHKVKKLQHEVKKLQQSLLQIFALFGQAVADVCLIWPGVALFHLQDLICAACQEYKSLQTSVFSSVTLGLQTHEHQLTLELISLGSPF